MERLDEELEFKQKMDRKRYIIFGLVAVSLGFTTGILIGVYGINKEDKGGPVESIIANPPSSTVATKGTSGAFLEGVTTKIIEDGDAGLTEKIIALMAPDNIRENLSDLSQKQTYTRLAMVSRNGDANRRSCFQLRERYRPLERSGDDLYVTEVEPDKRRANGYRVVMIALGALFVGVVIGISIGVYAVILNVGDCLGSGKRCNGHMAFLEGVPAKIIEDGDPGITQKIFDLMTPGNMRENLRNLTAQPHLAGTPADFTQARQLFQQWKDLGLDEVRLSPYDVLLSYPNNSDPNRVMLIDESGNTTFSSSIAEKILSDRENKSDVVLPFNAYSPKGDIKADLIYVNYARREDFEWLVNNNINVTGKLIIARYGKIFRGDKIKLALMHGALGVILYSDPKDYSWGDNPLEYPHDWWLPGSGVQRGVAGGIPGDMITPGYPAIKSAYRYSEDSENVALPKIPSHPIGYDDAKVLLSQLGGEEAPVKWRGALNVTYRIGGLRNPNTSVHLHVATYNSMRTTYNVIGIIKGEIEPDRYVMLGNHRDAWVFGAIDPSSGTAAMMEVVRVYSQLIKTGWRPRRSLIFCSWGAEEYGLVGSTEWVENYIKSLGERAVAYLNVDIAVQGGYSLKVKASPVLYKLLYEAAKKIPNPNPSEVTAGRKTVYDTFLYRYEIKDKNGTGLGKPKILNLGSGSDFATFIHRIGVPCADARYTYDENTMKLGSYPLYHSAYETFYAVDQLIDNGFKYHTAVANFWAESARHLADSLILPFDIREYGTALDGFRQTLYDQYGDIMEQRGAMNISELTSAIEAFQQAAADFHIRLESIDKNNPLTTRMVNDQMIQVERAFIDPEGLPGRPLRKHIVFAPSSVNSYLGASFPGLADGLYGIDSAPDEAARWEAVKHHYSVVVFTVLSAASTLQDVTKFMDS